MKPWSSVIKPVVSRPGSSPEMSRQLIRASSIALCTPTKLSKAALDDGIILLCVSRLHDGMGKFLFGCNMVTNQLMVGCNHLMKLYIKTPLDIKSVGEPSYSYQPPPMNLIKLNGNKANKGLERHSGNLCAFVGLIVF
jgi:hypothetical protein